MTSTPSDSPFARTEKTRMIQGVITNLTNLHFGNFRIYEDNEGVEEPQQFVKCHSIVFAQVYFSTSMVR